MTASSEPTADAVAAAWWEATKQRRLIVQHCPACRRWQHPPRLLCTQCSKSPEWQEVSGNATVDAWTQVSRPPPGGPPPGYVVARVRLEEGPILLTHLVGSDRWQCGQPVQLTWQPLDDGRALPVFEPPGAALPYLDPSRVSAWQPVGACGDVNGHPGGPSVVG